MNKLLFLLFVFPSYLFAQNNVFTFKQYVSNDYERERLSQSMISFDLQPTGLYIEAGKTIYLNLQTLTQSSDGRKAELYIGTPGRDDTDGRAYIRRLTLNEGSNTLKNDTDIGNPIYIRYISEARNPTGEVRLTFTSSSQHIKQTVYKLGTTTRAQFVQDFNTNINANEILFISKYCLILAGRENVKKISIDTYKGKVTNIDSLLSFYDFIVEQQNRISGLSFTNSNPLHWPLDPNVKIMMVESLAGYNYMSATHWVTKFYFGSSVAMERILSDTELKANTWGISHEMGHQRQQLAYKISEFGEVTVNIYSSAVEIGKNKESIKFAENVWNRLPTHWFNQPDNLRNFKTDDIKDVLDGLGYDKNTTRFLLLDQLRLLFGEEFYINLHKVAREEKLIFVTEEERYYYFVLRAMMISGFDLREYFYHWGIFLPDHYQNLVNNYIIDKNLPKPPYYDKIHLLTPFQKPWTDSNLYPLIEKGIKAASFTVNYTASELLSLKNTNCINNSDGVITDSRDGLKYSYKRYGNKDWFTENLKWNGYNGSDINTRGTKGVNSLLDPNGEVFGRYYNFYTNNAGFCPTGWSIPTTTDWNNLIAAIEAEYNLNNKEAINALRCGNQKNADYDLSQKSLWISLEPSYNQVNTYTIGFNATPGGVINADRKFHVVNNHLGVRSVFLDPGITWFSNIIANNHSQSNYLSTEASNIRCVRNSTTVNESFYQNAPISIPGVVEAEYFNKGGQSKAYLVQTTGNSGNANFRTTEDVDISNTSDNGPISSLYEVVNIKNNDYLRYLVKIEEEGSYTLAFRLKSTSTGKIDFRIDAQNITIPVTYAGNTAWQTVVIEDVKLKKGVNNIQLNFISNANLVSLNYFSLTNPQLSKNTKSIFELKLKNTKL